MNNYLSPDLIWTITTTLVGYIGGGALINWRLAQLEKRLDAFLLKEVADEKFRHIQEQIDELKESK